jgi:N-acetylglucosamine kinase-like BadF-type ATPase
LAGADREQDRKLIREWAERTGLATHVEVTGDAQILLTAGTPDGSGVAIIAGTGSIAIGRHADGRFARAGGWGYLLGDEGSGYALVMDALKAIVRSADGVEPPTSLTERLLTAMDLKQPIDLIPAVYRGGWDRTALSALAPHVLAAAEAGDPAAVRIVAAESEELARAAARVVEALGLDPKAVPLALAGGTLLGSDAYRGRLLAALANRGIRAEPVSLVREPALGAVRLASAACRA